MVRRAANRQWHRSARPSHSVLFPPRDTLPSHLRDRQPILAGARVRLRRLVPRWTRFHDLPWTRTLYRRDHSLRPLSRYMSTSVFRSVAGGFLTAGDWTPAERE